MGLIRTALRKPISILVLVAGLLFFGISAVRTIKVDIFPQMNLPVIYVSHPLVVIRLHKWRLSLASSTSISCLFVNGIKIIETKNAQGLTLMKITFYPKTNMAQAAAELSAFLATGRRRFFRPDHSLPLLYALMLPPCR